MSRAAARRKRRTRQHVIADLSLNHVERFILRRGHTAEPFRRDYGLDLLVLFYDRQGFVVDGQVVVQLKASDRMRYLDGRRTVGVRIDERDLDAWLHRLEPVILVAYDAKLDRAYWLYVQAALQLQATPGKRHNPPRGGTRSQQQRSRVVRIPVSQVVNEASVDLFMAYNAQTTAQVRKVFRHVPV